MLPQLLQQGQKRHSKDGVIASFGTFKQLQAQPFKAVGADTLQDFRFFSFKVGFEELVRKTPHPQAD